jgi:integrase
MLRVPARKVALKDRDVSLLPVVQADLKTWLVASGVRSGLILPRPDGSAWAEDDWRNWRSRVYQLAAKAVGVTGDMRAYRLRGSYASLLLYEGRPLTYVADELGNSPAVLCPEIAGLEEGGRRRSARAR